MMEVGLEITALMGGLLVGVVVYYVCTSIGKIVRTTEIISGVQSD